MPQTGYVGGSTAAKQDLGIGHSHGQYQSAHKINQAPADDTGYKSQYNGGQAPSYVTDVTGQLGNTKPQGKNLHEGGFSSDPKYNASFNSDIGTRQDPGRDSENAFQRRVAESGPDAGGGPRQKGVDNEHWYQPLARDRAA